MMQTVTAVIPNWNGRRYLARLLKDLRSQSYPVATTIVIDNGSSDGSVELALQSGARVVNMGLNAGFAKAVNRGILDCHTPLVAILNNDVELDPAWLENLVKGLNRCHAAFATGKIYSAWSRKQLDGTFDLLSRGGCAWRCGHGRQDAEIWNRPVAIYSAPLTAALFHTEVFSRAGLLDEAFESYLEDVEFGLRCARYGFSGIYVPEAIAWHWGSATLGLWHGETIRRQARNQILLLARHYPARFLWRNLWRVLVCQVLYGFLAARHGCAWSYLRGKVEGVLAFRRLRGKDRNRLQERLEEILSGSEDLLWSLQRQTTADLYWRLYFLLTRGRWA